MKYRLPRSGTRPAAAGVVAARKSRRGPGKPSRTSRHRGIVRHGCAFRRATVVFRRRRRRRSSIRERADGGWQSRRFPQSRYAACWHKDVEMPDLVATRGLDRRCRVEPTDRRTAVDEIAAPNAAPARRPPFFARELPSPVPAAGRLPCRARRTRRSNRAARPRSQPPTSRLRFRRPTPRRSSVFSSTPYPPAPRRSERSYGGIAAFRRRGPIARVPTAGTTKATSVLCVKLMRCGRESTAIAHSQAAADARRDVSSPKTRRPRRRRDGCGCDLSSRRRELPEFYASRRHLVTTKASGRASFPRHKAP